MARKHESYFNGQDRLHPGKSGRAVRVSPGEKEGVGRELDRLFQEFWQDTKRPTMLRERMRQRKLMASAASARQPEG